MAPCLQLEVKLCPLLKYTLRRPAHDDDPRPFVFVLSPLNEGYNQSGFVLLRHTSDGKLETVPIPDAIQGPLDIVNVKYPFDVTELKPGRSIVYCDSLPGRYREQLDPVKRTSLSGPGRRIGCGTGESQTTMWDPGS
jgi:hypothetical protein